MLTNRDRALKSVRLRQRTLQAIHAAGAGHTGDGLSCREILNVLYNRILNVSPATFGDPRRDRYVQSKGHSVETLYAVLGDGGFFPAAALRTSCHYQSPWAGHPTRHVPGIEMNTGALGHGLPICVGMALAGKMDAASYRVFTLPGDGELAEGSNWEAALAAAHHQLDHLTVIIDLNALQISGRTRDVCPNEPLDDKWRAFGWAVKTVDGHNFAELTGALSQPAEPGKPTWVIARTVKGRGVSFREDVARWHQRVPTTAELQQALGELDAAAAKLEASS